MMRRTWGSLALTLLLAPACSGDEATDAGIDVGEEPVDAGRDAAANDTGMDDAGMDAGMDAGGADASIPDAGTDAGLDASTGPAFMLFANIDGMLVRIDTTTGEVTDVGPTEQDFIVLAWDEEAGVTRVISQPYSPLGGAASPRLGTIDLCSGVISASTPLNVGATAVRRAEGLARDPVSGTWWISYGVVATSGATQFTSESIGTVDITTGAVTARAMVDTHQDDADLLAFLGEDLYLLDVATALSAGSLYAVDLVTGAQTSAVNTGPTVLRVAHDPSSDLVYALTGSTGFTNRGVGTLSLETGAVTPIGPYLANSDYPGASFTAAVFARTPICDL